jgi:cytochrome c oxidase cbb3-type subunit 3
MGRPGTATMFQAIKGGGSSVGLSDDMPNWNIDLTDDEIHDLVAFVRTFCKKK